MPVHPQAQAYLKVMGASSLIKSTHTDMAAFRAAKDKGSRPPIVPPVAEVKDLQYPGAAGPIRLRLYNHNPEASEPQPALIYIHGGGWCFDNIECHDSICRDLAKQSSVVVLSLDYRLAPEHPFPAGLEDCYAAVQWIHSSAKQLNIDRNRLALGGDSAGANLTAAVLMLTHQRQGAKILFQMLHYPCMHLEAQTPSRKLFANGYGASQEMIDWVFSCYAGDHDTSDPLMSPLLAEDLSYMPPAQVLTAEYDPVRDEGKLYADRLLQQGVKCTYTCYDGMLHGFLNHMYMTQLDVGDQAMADSAKLLKSALHAQAKT